MGVGTAAASVVPPATMDRALQLEAAAAWVAEVQLAGVMHAVEQRRSQVVAAPMCPSSPAVPQMRVVEVPVVEGMATMVTLTKWCLAVTLLSGSLGSRGQLRQDALPRATVVVPPG